MWNLRLPLDSVWDSTWNETKWNEIIKVYKVHTLYNVLLNVQKDLKVTKILVSARVHSPMTIDFKFNSVKWVQSCLKGEGNGEAVWNM